MRKVVSAHDVWRWDDHHKLQPTQRHWGTRTKPRTQGGGPPGWMWCGRCGWVSVCLRTLLHLGTLCRRTESQQAGPDTLLLWWRQGGGDGWLFYYRCTRQCNHHHHYTEVSRICVSKHDVSHPSSPCDSSVCHSYINTSSPLHLPVTAASQTLSTQHLGPGVKSLWVVRIKLILFNPLHLPEVLRQREKSVGCVWVQCESTGIWRENKTWLGGWRSGRFPVFRSGPVHEPKPVWCDANRPDRHLSQRDQ